MLMKVRSRPHVISRHGVTLDGRILDWDLPIPAEVLAGTKRGTHQTAEDEQADIVLTGADTLWPFPPRWRPVPGTPAEADPQASAEALLTDHLVSFPSGAPRYAITESRARLPRQFFEFELSDGSQPPARGTEEAGWRGPPRPAHADQPIDASAVSRLPPFDRCLLPRVGRRPGGPRRRARHLHA